MCARALRASTKQEESQGVGGRAMQRPISSPGHVKKATHAPAIRAASLEVAPPFGVEAANGDALANGLSERRVLYRRNSVCLQKERKGKAQTKVNTNARTTCTHSYVNANDTRAKTSGHGATYPAAGALAVPAFELAAGRGAALSLRHPTTITTAQAQTVNQGAHMYLTQERDAPTAMYS